MRLHLGDVLAAAQRDAEQPAHAGEAGDGGLAACGQRLPEIGHGAVPDSVQDEVVALPARGEVGSRVVDDVVGA